MQVAEECGFSILRDKCVCNGEVVPLKITLIKMPDGSVQTFVKKEINYSKSIDEYLLNHDYNFSDTRELTL